MMRMLQRPSSRENATEEAIQRPRTAALDHNATFDDTAHVATRGAAVAAAEGQGQGDEAPAPLAKPGPVLLGGALAATGHDVRGGRVLLVGLRRAQEHNGRLATLEAWLPEPRGRYTVRLVDAAGTKAAHLIHARLHAIVLALAVVLAGARSLGERMQERVLLCAARSLLCVLLCRPPRAHHR